MSRKETRKESKLIRCIKSPIRFLGKARDFYIRTMTRWAGNVEQGGGVMGSGAPTAQVSSLPKSFSVNSANSSNDDDLRDLIRAASTRSLESKVQLELLRRQPVAANEVVPRSQSVGSGRIDEDKFYEYENDDVVKVNTDFVPRSKSYAVTRRANGF